MYLIQVLYSKILASKYEKKKKWKFDLKKLLLEI
jgi:hypothetical protein